MKVQGGRMTPVDSREIVTARAVDAALERLKSAKDTIYRQTIQLHGPDADKIRAKLNTIDQAILEAIHYARVLSKNI